MMMKKVIFMLLLSVGIGSWATAQEQDSVEIVKLEVHTFLEQVKDTTGIQLIDVRTAEEFQGGHVKHAININLNAEDFEEQVAKLDKSTPVYLYCLGGVRSAKAAERLKKQGFEHIFEMKGGMTQWRSNNLPEVKEVMPEEGNKPKN